MRTLPVADHKIAVNTRGLSVQPTHTLPGLHRHPRMRGVQHRCIEANELEDVGKAHDLVQEREIPITLSPRHHAMDTMISFYLRTPTGFDVEFGANGELIDDATFVQTNPSYSEAWGHRTITHGWAPTASATLMLPLPDVDASLHELERISFSPSHQRRHAQRHRRGPLRPYDPGVTHPTIALVFSPLMRLPELLGCLSRHAGGLPLQQFRRAEPPCPAKTAIGARRSTAQRGRAAPGQVADGGVAFMIVRCR